MRRFLLVALLASAPAFAQFTAGNMEQGGPSGSGVSSVSTAAITGCSTGGQYFFVVGITNQNGLSGVTVSSTSIPSGSWTVYTPQPGGGGYLTYAFAYSSSITNSEVVTATKSGAMYSARIAGGCFAGALSNMAAIVDQQNAHNCGNNQYLSACAPGSITPLQGSELIFSVMIDNKNEITAAPTGYTAAGSTFSTGGAGAYVIQTTPTATNPSWPMTADYHYCGTLVVGFRAASPTLDYTVSGPASGPDYNASTAFTVSKVSGNFNGSMTITIADGSQGGTITPSVGSPGVSTVTVTPTNGTSSFTFTYTPNVVGAITLTFTGAGMAGSNPNPAVYTSIALTITNSCVSGTGLVGAASSTCTITASLTFNGTQTITLADDSEYVCGTFTPSVGSPGAILRRCGCLR